MTVEYTEIHMRLSVSAITDILFNMMFDLLGYGQNSTLSHGIDIVVCYVHWR